MTQFDHAQQYLHEKLRYMLDPDHCEDFKILLKQSGYRRFTTAVDIVRLQSPTGTAVERHNRLLDVMHELLPKHKATTRTK